jgi:hypothetical protein
MGTTATRLVLKWPYLLIALLPIAVFVATDLLLHHFGGMVDEMPPFFARFDAHSEAAGRLTLLGMFILFIGVAVGAIAYFVSTALLLDYPSRMKVAAAFGGLMLFGTAILHFMDTREMQDYMGPSFVCAALGHSSPSGADDADAAAANAVRPQVATDRRQGGECQNPRFSQLRTLLVAHKIAMMFCVAALVLGSLCCLAILLGSAVANDRKLAHYEAQSSRLNIYLYLSALFLVTGLFFMAAYAQWPAYVLLSKSTYDGHVNAFVAYLGFSYTLLIASFYAPAAAIVAARFKAAAGNSDAGLPDAFKGPLQILKIGAALFSTTLAGALPAMLGLGT